MTEKTMLEIQKKELLRDFEPIVRDMFTKLEKKIPRFGLSYRDCQLDYLWFQFHEHLNRMQDNPSYENMIDVANFAVMLAFRGRKKEG